MRHGRGRLSEVLSHGHHIRALLSLLWRLQNALLGIPNVPLLPSQ